MLYMKFLKIILSTLVLFAITQIDTTEAQESQATDIPEIVVITMHADWCGTCKELNPKVDNVKSEFEDKVLFTKFDFTDESTTKQTRLMANWIGIGDVFVQSENRGATGYIILLDGNTFEEVGRITNEKNEGEIRETISSLL